MEDIKQVINNNSVNPIIEKNSLLILLNPYSLNFNIKNKVLTRDSKLTIRNYWIIK